MNDNNNDIINQVNERSNSYTGFPDLSEQRSADFEKAEMDLLKNALDKNSSQRFDTLMQLIKLGFMLKNAKISHKPYKV